MVVQIEDYGAGVVNNQRVYNDGTGNHYACFICANALAPVVVNNIANLGHRVLFLSFYF